MGNFGVMSYLMPIVLFLGLVLSGRQWLQAVKHRQSSRRD